MSDDLRPSNLFGVRVDREASGAVLKLSGELDIACEEPFKAAVEEALEADDGELTVDLSEVAFIDSSGLRFLIELWDRARRQELDLTFVQGTGMVRRTLEISGLDRVLPIADRGSSRAEPV